ncbi:MAG: hypothetical protein R2706_19530 [Acidimicrobiales bacterium]
MRDVVLAETKAGLTRIAEYENVSIKLGGIGMTRYGTDWLPPRAPHVRRCRGDMGPDASVVHRDVRSQPGHV